MVQSLQDEQGLNYKPLNREEIMVLAVCPVIRTQSGCGPPTAGGPIPEIGALTRPW